MDIAEKIRTAREARGLSREDLARIVDVTGQSIYLWETGRSHPLRKNVLALAGALNLPLGEVLEGERIEIAFASVEELLEKVRRAVGLRHDVSPESVRVDISIAIPSNGG